MSVAMAISQAAKSDVKDVTVSGIRSTTYPLSVVGHDCVLTGMCTLHEHG